VGWGKVVFWSTKAAISLKRERERKSYYRGPIGTHQRSFEWYHPEPYGLFFPKTAPPKTAITIISGTCTAADFKFGRYRYIHSVHPNKSPLNFLEKRERGRIQELPNFCVPPIVSRMDKATKFTFCTHVHRIDRNKTPLKIAGKVAVSILRDSGKFSGDPYRAHRAVIFAIAQLSCLCITLTK